MKIIIKYKVEKPFRDKNTKEDITANTMLDISLERMKELNAANIGRAEDVIVLIDEIQEESSINYSQEKLELMSVNELKEFAEKENIELTKSKKTEIIEELLEKIKE